jgi:serine/threonine protein kinase
MLSGGRLFGEGMYGCIFTPSLQCKNKQDQPPLTEDKAHPPLSKIILRQDAELEFSISNIIRKIPIWKNYFAVAESICEPAKKQTDKELKDCAVIMDHPISEFRILSMSYYGVPATTYRFHLDHFDFMGFVTHFIQAGALLNLFGIVHRDIHQGNILIDSHDVPRIIDFNLAIPVELPLIEGALVHQYTYMISQEPPDSTLVNAMHLVHTGNLKISADKVIEDIIIRKPIIKTIMSVLHISRDSMHQSMLSFYQRSKSMKAGDLNTWFQTYWRTIDSWAIGVNLVDFIRKLSLWPSFRPILAKNKAILFPMLKRMCAVSPIDRIDCVQALYHLDPANFIIKKYGKAWIDKVGTI